MLGYANSCLISCEDRQRGSGRLTNNTASSVATAE